MTRYYDATENNNITCTEKLGESQLNPASGTKIRQVRKRTNYSGYATWFTAGGAIRIAHYDVIDDVITRKL